ncbi:MAG: hypothetical protein RLZZ152_2217, partial [Pseudomonadota bacterium]
MLVSVLTYRVGTKLAANANTELGTFILTGWLL